MRKRLLSIGMVVSLSVLASCGPEVKEDIATKRRVGQIADKVLTDSSTVYFSLDSLTGYSWDEVFIITPYSQLDKLGRRTNVDFSPIEKAGIESNDSKNILAFITNGKVIGYVDLPINKGDFSHLNDSFGDSIFTYSFGEAKFRMVNERGWAVIEKFTSGNVLVH